MDDFWLGFQLILCFLQAVKHSSNKLQWGKAGFYSKVHTGLSKAFIKGVFRMKNFINGETLGSDTSIDVLNPLNQKWIDSVPNAGEKEAKLAVDSAHDAFQDWKDTTAYERAAFLWRWHQLIDAQKEELATTMTQEQGKPLKEALGEIEYANSYIA